MQINDEYLSVYSKRKKFKFKTKVIVYETNGFFFLNVKKKINIFMLPKTDIFKKRNRFEHIFLPSMYCRFQDCRSKLL